MVFDTSPLCKMLKIVQQALISVQNSSKTPKPCGFRGFSFSDCLPCFGIVWPVLNHFLWVKLRTTTPKMRANGLNYRTTFLAFPSPPRSFLPFKPSAFLCKIGLAKFDQIWTNEYDFIAKALSVPAGRFLHFRGLMFRDQKKPSLFLTKEVAAFSISRTERNQQKRGET